MSDLNALFLQGRLTKDADMNTMSNGSCVVTLSLAVNKDYLDRNTNEWKKLTNFFEVNYWGQVAKNNFAEYTKGREVLIEAELKTSTWEKNGKNYSRVEIRANKVRALRRPGEGKRLNAEGAPAQNYANTPPAAPDFDGAPDTENTEYAEHIPY